MYAQAQSESACKRICAGQCRKVSNHRRTFANNFSHSVLSHSVRSAPYFGNFFAGVYVSCFRIFLRLVEHFFVAPARLQLVQSFNRGLRLLFAKVMARSFAGMLRESSPTRWQSLAKLPYLAAHSPLFCEVKR